MSEILFISFDNPQKEKTGAGLDNRQMNDEQLAAAGIPAGLIRISCGLEDKADLIADIAQALDTI